MYVVWLTEIIMTRNANIFCQSDAINAQKIRIITELECMSMKTALAPIGLWIYKFGHVVWTMSL